MTSSAIIAEYVTSANPVRPVNPVRPSQLRHQPPRYPGRMPFSPPIPEFPRSGHRFVGFICNLLIMDGVLCEMEGHGARDLLIVGGYEHGSVSNAPVLL